MSTYRLNTLVTGLAALAMSSAASADLVNFKVPTPEGDTATYQPSVKYVAANKGQITFAVSGGLERRVLVAIRKGSSDLVSKKLTNQISASDKIEVDGKEYYGYRVSLPVPKQEGSYNIQVALADKSGAVLKSAQYPVYLDTEKPYEPQSQADKVWQDPNPGVTHYDGTVSIDGGEPQPFSYSPTQFSPEDYNYADASATGLLQLSDKAWIKISVRDGKLYYINVLDKQNDGSGGNYKVNFTGLPDGSEVVVSDDPMNRRGVGGPELNLSQTPTGDWHWEDKRTDGGVISIPFNDKTGVEFNVQYSDADGIKQLVLLNNEGAPYNLDRVNTTLGFHIGGDLSSLQLDRWEYFESTEKHPFYKIDVIGQNLRNPSNWTIQNAQLYLYTPDGDEAGHISAESSQRDGVSYEYRFNPKQAVPQSGNYSLVLKVSDNNGNEQSFPIETRFFDIKKPTIEVLKDRQPFKSGTISSLDDLSIQLSDANDPKPKLTSLHLEGGAADDDLYLTAHKEGVYYHLEYPVMFPSVTDSQSYQLTMVGRDAQGNTVEKTIHFSYEPPRVSLADGSDGAISIPAVNHAFKHRDGSELISSKPLKLRDGEIISESYDLIATLRSDAEVPLTVNGIRVEPGQTKTVESQYDFGATNGVINVPVQAAEEGVSGSSNLLITTSAPNAPVLNARFNVWTGAATLSAQSWEVNQAIQPVRISAAPNADTPCKVVASKSDAQAADMISSPVCHLTWDKIPSGLEAKSSREDEDSEPAPVLVGRPDNTGDQSIEYSLWVYDRDGNPYLLEQGSKILKVVKPENVIAFKPGQDVSEFYHAVQSIDFGIEQSEGPDCAATIDRDAAVRSALDGSSHLTCLVEWTQLPKGLSQLSYRSTPELRGKLETAGTNKLAWRVSTFNSNGDKVVLSERSVEINAAAPPEPTISMGDEYRFAPSMYAAPMEGGYLGDTKVSSYNASLSVDLSRSGKTYQSATSPAGWGEQNVVQRRINADKRDLWSQTQYEVAARYADLPEVGADKTFKVVAVPSRNIAPVIEADGDTVLNTEPLKVTTRIANPFVDTGYDPATMGEWKVRVVKLRGQDVTPITDYETMPSSGERTFTLDLDDLNSKRVRLAAQAEVISPVPGYDRTVLANRPIYMTILRGQPIDSTIEGRRISGEAPLTAVMTLKIDNRLDKAALGEVKWQVSADKQNWSALENSTRFKSRLTHRFERGNYFVRAIVTNTNSGATFKTPIVAVSAYLLPAINLNGPENAFIQSIADYTVARDDSRSGNDPDTPLAYQWSTDRGETWVDGEPEFHISRNKEARVPVWVRARYETAPAGDDDAWTRERTRVSFRKVRPPRVRIIGPRLVETGKPDDFRAAVRAPYRKMDIDIEGEWTLPGGGHNADSRELTYTATEADLANERVDLVYETWVAGYKNKGALDSDTSTLRIWQYEWPDFRMTVRKDSDYAPSDVVTRLRSAGTTRFRDLDEPKVEWKVPDGLTLTDPDRTRTTSRSLHAAKPGEYTLQATVSDARGHSAVVSHTLVFKPAPPYKFDFRYTASNRYDRAPMEIRVRPYISGGHPRDRIESYSYTLDGQPVDTQSRFGEMMIDKAGTHRIGVKIQTQMGNTARGHLDLTAKVNQPPSCKIKARSAQTYYRFYARCDDPDGRMSGYKWLLNGEQVGTSSYRITVRKDGDGAPTVEVIGKDDSGAASKQAIWHGDP